MQLGSRVFVGLIFIVLGASFWANTAQLYLEFAHGMNLWTLPARLPYLDSVVTSLVEYDRATWFLLLTHYSDLFIFFPVFGTVALIAFYTPACVLVDMYWNVGRQSPRQRIPYSRFRFSIGFVIVALLSYAIANFMLQGTERTLWQLKPYVLETDAGDACTSAQDCQRVPFLKALTNIQIASRERVSLADLGRNCGSDPFIQPPRQPRPDRFCPVNTNLLQGKLDAEGKWQPDEVCCRAQKLFDAAIKQRFDAPERRSATNDLQSLLWPFKIFFLLTLLVISGLLAFRRDRIEKLYQGYTHTIDRGVMIGAMAMLPLPLMHNGFLLTTKLLHGEHGATSLHRIPETFTVAFGLWALLIILSFLHPSNKQAEISARVLGVIASVVFALQASTATDYTIYWIGAGAGAISLATMLAVAVLLLIVLYTLRDTGPAEEPETPARPPQSDTGAAQPAPSTPATRATPTTPPAR